MLGETDWCRPLFRPEAHPLYPYIYIRVRRAAAASPKLIRARPCELEDNALVT